MKKLSFFYLFVTCILISYTVQRAQAQTIIPGSLTEYINPIASTGNVASVVAHVSNYHYEAVEFQLGDAPGVRVQNDLYVWAWGGINTADFSSCGIGWKRTAPSSSTAVINEGFISLDKFVFDPEIAFIEFDKNIYVVLAYYQSLDYFGVGDAGHKYDIYRWDSNTLTPVSLGNYLSTLPDYTRISIDAHRLNALAITWETPNGIYVKGIRATTSGLEFSDDVYVYTGDPGKAPDIAFFQMEGRQYVRLLYTIPTGAAYDANYYVEHRLFDDLFGTLSLAFVPDHTFPDEYRPVLGLDGLYHQIDCPDNSAEDRWAVSYYSFLTETVRLLIKNPISSIIVDLDVLNGSFSPASDRKIDCTAVAYDPKPDLVHVGFHITDHLVGANSNYYAVCYTETGTKIVNVFPDEFKAVANTPYAHNTTSSLAFSKQNAVSSQMFTTYHTSTSFLTAISDIRHKHADIPGVYSTFSHGRPVDAAAAPDLLIYPNPVLHQAALSILPGEHDVMESCTLRITDLRGQVLHTISGSPEAVQRSFFEVVPGFGAGIYQVRIDIPGEVLSRTFIKL